MRAEDQGPALTTRPPCQHPYNRVHIALTTFTTRAATDSSASALSTPRARTSSLLYGRSFTEAVILPVNVRTALPSRRATATSRGSRHDPKPPPRFCRSRDGKHFWHPCHFVQTSSEPSPAPGCTIPKISEKVNSSDSTHQHSICYSEPDRSGVAIPFSGCVITSSTSCKKNVGHCRVYSTTNISNSLSFLLVCGGRTVETFSPQEQYMALFQTSVRAVSEQC
jgi:hypothetical protein